MRSEKGSSWGFAIITTGKTEKSQGSEFWIQETDMGFIGKLFGKNVVKIPSGPFTARIIFECARVPQNQEKVTAALEEFMGKYSAHIAEDPRLTQARDGNVIELTLRCRNKDELMWLNRELESIARRYGLRDG